MVLTSLSGSRLRMYRSHVHKFGHSRSVHIVPNSWTRKLNFGILDIRMQGKKIIIFKAE